jgi:hypothetical protein
MEAQPLVNGWSTPLSVSVFATCVVFTVLTVVFTGLRFIARSEKHAHYGPDDWVILAATVYGFIDLWPSPSY